jgi:hypothetical protein
MEDRMGQRQSTYSRTLSKRNKEKDDLENNQEDEDEEDNKKETVININGYSVEEDTEEGSKYEWPTLVFLIIILLILYFWDIF